MDPAVVRRLVLALTASAAIHLSLLYTVRLAAPAPDPATPVLRARLQAGKQPAARDESSVSPAQSHVRLRAKRTRQAVERALPPEAAEVATAAYSPAPERQSAAPELLPAVEAPFVRDTTWYPARQLDVFPTPVVTPQPAYPDQAGIDGIRGEVTLLMLIDETGVVHEVSVVEAHPEGYFEAPAVAAFQGVRFEPARKGGRAVRSRVLVKVAFSPD